MSLLRAWIFGIRALILRKLEERSSYGDDVARRLNDETSYEDSSTVSFQSDKEQKVKNPKESSDMHPAVMAWLMNRPGNKLYCDSSTSRSSIVSTV